MRELIKSLILGALTLCTMLSQAQNAPVTDADEVLEPGSSASVPVYVTDFGDIASISLTLEYNPLIAGATSVTPNPALAGSFVFNTGTPGIIIISWFDNTGITLADGSVLFTIQFSRVEYGLTPITFNDNGLSCEYASYDLGYVNALDDEPYVTHYLTGNLTFMKPAPIITAPEIEACAGTSVSIPFTITDFDNIGSISLTLTYNPTVLAYTGYNANTSLPGNLTVSGVTSGTITLFGAIDSEESGITLDDGSLLFTLEFNYLGGTSPLEWVNEGASSEYGNAPGPDFATCYDLPTLDYFINGEVSDKIRPTVEVSGNETICNGNSGSVIFTLTGTAPWNITYTDGLNSVNIVDITTGLYEITVSPTQSTTYFATALSDGQCAALGNDITGTSIITVVECELHAKNFLQGAYNVLTHQMNTYLQQFNQIPNNQPYGATPLGYSGTEAAASFNSEVVDWLLAELRTGTGASTSICRQAVLLLSDGRIVDAENQTIPPVFPVITPGNLYYVVFYHRNHLPVMSANPVLLPNTNETLIDFTTLPSTNVYGGLNGVIPVETDKYGQISGDINMDNKLIYSGSNNDRGLIFSKINSVLAPQPVYLNSSVVGYFTEDLNMNGTTLYSGNGNDQGVIFMNIDYFTNPTYLNTIFFGVVPMETGE
jgi:hypothetical protein